MLKSEKIEIEIVGRPYLLIGSREQGTIATVEQFENFRESTAHLVDGKIMRHGTQIGSIEDIKFIDKKGLSK